MTWLYIITTHTTYSTHLFLLICAKDPGRLACSLHLGFRFTCEIAYVKRSSLWDDNCTVFGVIGSRYMVRNNAFR